MKLIVGFLLAVTMMGCTCVAQIPTQFYFANDTCEFYLPDYSQAVEVRDNCCVDSMGLQQWPPAGEILIPGNDIWVTLTGTDCSGNSVFSTFEVVVIDTVPPTFFYDSAQFIPTGQYQNDEHVVNLYIVVDSTSMDTLGIYNYRMYYRDVRSEQPIQANIYDDGYRRSTLDTPDKHRAQIFTAPTNSILTKARIKMYRIGYMPGQNVVVELREVDSTMNPAGPILSKGTKKFSEVFTDVEGGWYTIPMRPTTIYQGQKYAIIVHLDIATTENKLVWRTNQEGLFGGHSIWTDNGYSETGTWQFNPTADRLFEIWGRKL